MNAAEILLIGTGERVEMMPPALRQYLNKAGIQVDIMNTVSRVLVKISISSSIIHSAMHVRHTTSSLRKGGASLRLFSL